MGLVCGAVRHYCLGGRSALVVCAGRSRLVQGGWGRCRVLCLPRAPLPAKRFLRCVWRAVPSGCPLSSLAGTPFHEVCAFRGLRPVALLVLPACPLCVCALARSRRPRPLPPPWLGLARAPRAVPVLGAGRAVPRGPCPSACPASVPCSVWFAWGVGRPGPISPYLTWGCALPVGWVRAWGPLTNSTARALASWLGTLWRRHEGARGGRLLPGRWASGVGRSPTPDHPSFPACGRGPLPTGCECGGCGRGDPSPTQLRALLRAGLARCGGGTRAPGEGRLLPGCGASGVGRPPTPDHSSFQACGRGPLPTGCGCGGCGCGDPSPTPWRAFLRAGFARCWGGMRVTGLGASCLRVGRPGSGALPPQTTRPFGRAAGAHYPLAVVAGGAGVGTRHERHSARSCELALRAVGAAGGCPGGGGASVLAVGRPGSGALPPLITRPFGRADEAHYPLAVGAGAAGVGTRHQPHSARSCELALRAVGAARGRPWGAPLARVWGVRGRAHSHPRTLVLSGVRPGPASHWPWGRCAGVGARLSLAPSPVPRFVVCYARFPCLRHLVGVVAWHLLVCPGSQR